MTDTDIRIIKALSRLVGGLVVDEEKVRQDLYQANCEVQKLEGRKNHVKKQLSEAREMLNAYDADWENKLKIEHWKDY